MMVALSGHDPERLIGVEGHTPLSLGIPVAHQSLDYCSSSLLPGIGGLACTGPSCVLSAPPQSLREIVCNC